MSTDSMLILATLFGVALATNATPFFGASYTLLATADLISTGFSLNSFGLIVLVTAAGATLAKLILYSGAFELRKELTRNRNVRLFHEWLRKRSFLVALFITAFIPVLPLDDYIYIGAGANRASIAPMLGVTFLAKIAKSTVEIFLEFNGIIDITSIARNIFGLSEIELTVVLSAFFIVLGILLYKLDWEGVLKRVGVMRTKEN